MEETDLPEKLVGDPMGEVSIEVPCPGRQEGRVIGKGGATIKEIERLTGANMKVVKGSGRCSINGPRHIVIEARRAVLDTLLLVVDRFHGGGHGAAAGALWFLPKRTMQFWRGVQILPQLMCLIMKLTIRNVVAQPAPSRRGGSDLCPWWNTN